MRADRFWNDWTRGQRIGRKRPRMSLINEALKRAKEAQKAAPASPAPRTPLRPTEPVQLTRTGPRGILPAIFIVVAGAAFFIVWHLMSANPSTQLPRTPAPSVFAHPA